MKNGHSNLLERQGAIPPRLRKPKQSSNVTIAIGFITGKAARWPEDKGRIILASDSEISYETAKRHDAQKIKIIKFSNGEVLAAY